MEPNRPKSFKEIAKAFIEDETSSGKPPTAEDLKKAARAALAAGAIAGTTPFDSASAQSITIKPYVERQATLDVLTDADIDALTKNAFYEARGESGKGQLGVAQVTLARLASGKFGKALRDVIYAKWQFSWTSEDQKPLSKKEKEDFANIRTLIGFALDGKSPMQAVRALAEHTGVPVNALFFKRSDWDEHNSEEKRMSEATKKVFRALVPVAQVDQHVFYAEPPLLTRKHRAK